MPEFLVSVRLKINNLTSPQANPVKVPRYPPLHAIVAASGSRSGLGWGFHNNTIREGSPMSEPDTPDPETSARPALIVPALGGLYERFEPWTHPVLRVVTGAMLIPHGWVKIVGGNVGGLAGYLGKLGLEPAYPLAVYLSCLELFGGAMLVAGLLTRLIAVQVIGFMAVAAFVVHWPSGFFWNEGGYEYPLFWGIMAMILAVRGGGAWSLDRRIGKEF